MGVIRIIAASAAVLGLVLTAAGSADAAKSSACVKAGGQGVGLGADIAKVVAGDALTEALAKGGLKGKGKVSMKCDDNPLLTTCTATQTACK
jgi:hypothetical protein